MARRYTSRVAAALTMIAGGALFSGCAKDFAGPYPCNTGFASCVTGSECETSVTSDPEHCGECGTTCPRGAICVDGECSAAPAELATDVLPNRFAMNKDNLFWSSYANAGIAGLRKQDDTGFSVTAPDLSPQPNPVFAVDDADLYYFGQVDRPGGGIDTRIQAVPADAVAAPAVRVVITMPDGFNVNQPQLTLVGDSLLLGENVQNGGPNGTLIVLRVPKVGGAPSGSATFSNTNSGSFVADSTRVYTTSTNQNCEIQSAPIAGGDSKTLLSDQHYGCPQVIASDGERLYFASSHTEYTNDPNNDDNGGQPQFQRCIVEISSIPVGGGPVTPRSTIVADEVPLRFTLDSGDVYLATNKSVWRMTGGDGAPERVAGNLDTTLSNGSSRGPGSTGCTYEGGGGFGPGNPYPVAVAVDDQDIYVVALKDTTGTLFRIPK
jgi:hypothetical protein